MDAQTFSAIVTALATIVLAIITGLYASYTRTMVAVMSRQIEPDIHIEGASVELFPEAHPHRSRGFEVNCDFKALIRNTNSAGGSVTEPDVYAILDDGTEIRARPRGEPPSIRRLSGGELQEIFLQYKFLIPFGDPKAMEKTTTLLSATTRFRISCMDNLGVDRGKGVPVTLASGMMSQPCAPSTRRS